MVQGIASDAVLSEPPILADADMPFGKQTQGKIIPSFCTMQGRCGCFCYE